MSASDAELRDLVEQAPDGIFVADADGRTRTVNRAACEMLGWGRGELLGTNVLDLFAPEDAPRFVETREQLRASGRAHLGEWTLRRRDGATLAVEISARVLPDGRLQAFARDIRERLRQREALARSEASFRALVESTPLGMVVSQGGTVVYVNAAIRALLGYERSEDLVGHGWADFLHTDSRALAEQRRAAIELGQPPAPDVLRYIHRAGHDVLLESSSVFITRDGEAATLAILRNVTSDRRAEEARAHAEAQVRAALAEKEVLLQEVHHRVKNNLQVIASLVNLQANKLGNPAMRAALEEIRARVRAIALLHEKLYQSRDLARIDMREYVESLVADLLRTYGALARGVAVTTHAEALRFDLDTAMPCGLILSELVANALKHAFPPSREEPGHVDVVLEATGGGAELSVTDDGVGLPSGADLDRSDSLGWMLVRTLTRQLRGRLRLQSERGVQCTIVFPTS